MQKFDIPMIVPGIALAGNWVYSIEDDNFYG